MHVRCAVRMAEPAHAGSQRRTIILASRLFARIISCGSDPAAPLRRPRRGFAGSSLLSAAGAVPCTGRAEGAERPAGFAAGASVAASDGSNCRPNCTDGSKKLLIGVERNHQPLGDAAERQADLEAILGHHQVPELVLQDDRHLFRILRQQPRRQLHAVGAWTGR